MQPCNHKKRELALSQQISDDAEPFRIERFPANGLACATIPVGCITLIAFLAMEVGVHPRALGAFVLLSRFAGRWRQSCGRRLETVDPSKRRERHHRIVRPLVGFDGLLCSLKMNDPTQLTRSRETRCDSCTRITPSYDIVNYGSIEGGYRHLCSQCFNKEVAEMAGLTGFENAKFEPVGLVYSTGELHEFHFRTHLFGAGVALDAFELCGGHPAGYKFQIIGDPEEDLLVLLGRLIEKMRRALSTKHLTDDEHGLQIAEQRVVRGRIEWDDARNGRVPLLVVDGREIDWDEFGRMLMSFEGWQFKLSIADKSEEL